MKQIFQQHWDMIIGLLFLIIAFVMLYDAHSATGDINLKWNAPTVNADGTPLTDLSGFRIYEVSGAGTTYKQIGNDIPKTNLSTIITLPKGNYCFVGTAYDLSGNEGAYSNTVCKDNLEPGTFTLTIVPTP